MDVNRHIGLYFWPLDMVTPEAVCVCEMVRGVQEIREFLLAEERWVRERPHATETLITAAHYCLT